MKVYTVIKSCAHYVELVQVFRDHADAANAYRQQQRLILEAAGVRTMGQLRELTADELEDLIWEEYYDLDWDDGSPSIVSWYTAELE